ncbi:MAG: hypothetical protein EU548_09780 [Promethearchaeota archaeon]|nr:MAG: hypothetical protein EU548_09780 [Candidatus Lokiarchaeota archaeon]
MSKKGYRNKGSKDNLVISIAGAHGVGKSTIINLLKKKYRDENKFKFFPERYKKIPPFPFGSSDKQIAFRSEIHFLQQLMKRNRSVLNYDERYNGRILFLDRTPICVLIYSKSLSLKEKDYQLIVDTYNSIEWRENYVIYLTAEPETILKRIVRRGSLDKRRREWNEEDKRYLTDILSYYNLFLFNENEEQNVITLNTDGLTPEQVVQEIESIITDLSGYSFEKTIKQPSTQMSLTKYLE